MGATSGQYWRWMGAFIEMHDRLRNIGKPTIARINGICVGGGNELQMACDLSVLVDDAYIRHVGPEHGSVPAGGATQWLPTHRRRPAGARDRDALRADPAGPGARLGPGHARRAARRAGRDGRRRWPTNLRAQAARGAALHQDAAQLVARPRLVADGRARARLAGRALRRPTRPARRSPPSTRSGRRATTSCAAAGRCRARVCRTCGETGHLGRTRPTAPAAAAQLSDVFEAIP